MTTKPSIDEFMSNRKGEIDASGRMQKGIIVPEPEDVDEKAKASRKFDAETRSARFVMSTETPDRDGDVLRQAGWQLDNFLKNPVCPLFHVMRSWPIGKWSDVETVLGGRPKRLEGTMTVLPEGGPIPEVEQAAWMLANGGLKAVSVGFMPLQIEYLDPEAGWMSGYDIIASELYECSLVTVPANPEALIKSADGDMRLAKDLIEHVLDVYAHDPRTGQFIERKELERAYKEQFGERYALILNVARSAGKHTPPPVDVDAMAKRVAEILAGSKTTEQPAPASPAVIPPVPADLPGKREAPEPNKGPDNPPDKPVTIPPRKAAEDSWLTRLKRIAGISTEAPEPPPSTKIEPGTTEKLRKRYEERAKQLQE